MKKLTRKEMRNIKGGEDPQQTQRCMGGDCVNLQGSCPANFCCTGSGIIPQPGVCYAC